MDLLGKIDQNEAVKIVRRWLNIRNIKAQRVAGYSQGSKIIVVIDGCKLNGSFERLARDVQGYGIDIVSHSSSFEVTE